MPSSDQFRRLERLFHELEELSDAERSIRLQELARLEPELFPSLLKMLNTSTQVDQGERLIDDLINVAGQITGEASSDPDQIGPYQLQKLIGEGGMGRVYLAEQFEPVRRRVAIKLTRRGLDSDEAMIRFRAERQALAVLEHPNIARVFDAGSTDGGRPWFAMEYIEGVPINRWATDKALSLRQRIELLLPVCEAVQHAHAKGLVHRDLKPSNILVVDAGGIGRPMVIDFGIARVVDLGRDDRTQATRIGELVGTPEYMSPEQASLGEIDIDTRSDIYSLGLVLHELLVGELPISAARLRAMGFQAMCREIREGDTPLPSRYREPTGHTATTQWRSRLRGDLDAVLLKALAKDRNRRYDTANGLAADLRRYLDGQPVLAQPPSFGYRAGKFVRRHRIPVLAASLVIIALVSGIVVAAHGLIQARAALAQAEWNLEQSDLNRNITNAYADALQRLFGASEDIEWMTAQLLQQATERHASRHEDPDSAALFTFAIGRHFLSRNDYASARLVFEPWLTEDYGDDMLKSYGWQLLAFAYRFTGESQLALSAFRRAGELDDPRGGMGPGQVSRLTQIALLSRQADDIETARQSLTLQLSTNEKTSQRMSLLNSLFQLETTLGNLDAALTTIRQAVAIIDANPGMELAGRDTNRINLARLELFVRQDFAAVQAQLDALRSGESAAKGESMESARALEIEGVMLRMQGQSETALATLESALQVLERYVGNQASTYVRTELELIVTLIDLGRLDEATSRLDAIRNRLQRPDLPSLTMAEAYLILAHDGPDAASELLLERQFDRHAFRGADHLAYHIAQLQAAGVKWHPELPNQQPQ